MRYNIKNIMQQVANINGSILAESKWQIEAVRANGRLNLYQVDREKPNTWHRHMFSGTAKECHIYLYGWTEIVYYWDNSSMNR